MFKFLKEKLKSALGKITKKVEEEAPEEIVEQQIEEQPKETKLSQKKQKEKPAKLPKKKQKKESPQREKEIKEIIEEPREVLPQEEKPITASPTSEEKLEQPQEQEQTEKKGFFSRFFKKKESIEQPEEEKPEQITPAETQKPIEAAAEEKKGFFGKLKEKIVTKKITAAQFEELFWELEVVLLENNVAVAVIDQIKKELHQRLVDKPLPRGQIESTIQTCLKESIGHVLAVPSIDLLRAIKEKKENPYVIVFFGVNGAGKTTTIARVAHLLKTHGINSVLVAADTFRAGAKEQLQEWGDRLHLKVISHDYEADPAAVSFDGIAYAQKQHIPVVLIDTAGRQHSNVNLVKQMEKIVRVAKPDLKIFVGEAITGNDAVTQSESFNASIGIDGIILTKSDVDEKGGAIVSVSYITKKPILYLGIGQELTDLEPFSAEHILRRIGL